MTPSRVLRKVAVGFIATATVFMYAGQSAWSYSLDKEGTIKLGLRTYVNARIGTQATDKTIIVAQPGSSAAYNSVVSQTFPYSPPGHLRQNRFYLEAELDHDVTKLMRAGFGPLALLNDLPFSIDRLKYHLTFRAEADGLYDWGPTEYSTANSYQELLADANGNINPPGTCLLGICPDIPFARRNLRKKTVDRERLYEAYIETTIGDIFLRIGRQVLVWGESDNFRLLDNINPLDASFGGFLLNLDERRVPLDMIRASYYIGEVGDNITEMSLEGFASIDDRVSYSPNIPEGSPWTLPNLGVPGGTPPGTTRNFVYEPPRNFKSIRGGARLSLNAYDITWSLAHYYTYADNPLVQTCVNPGVGLQGFPFAKISTRDPVIQSLGGRLPGCPAPVLDLPIQQPANRPPGTYAILAPTAYAVQLPAKIQVSGGSATGTIPASISRRIGFSGEPVVRLEVAYIKDEPAYTQRQLDPFVFHSLDLVNPKVTGGVRQRDSINALLGIDINQFIRPLNKLNSFFISTQFFYKHIKGAASDEVLPVPEEIVTDANAISLGALRPLFVRQSPDQYLQTLFISNSYRSGTINPSLTLFYDWSGAITYIPAVQFLHDPFRFSLEYDIIDAGRLKGNSGTSLYRDRDNLLFQFEYVI